MNEFSGFSAALNDLSVIEISGVDASAFLHSQLTHDVSGLQPGHARLAGYCTAKGRLLATMVVWRGPQTESPTFYALVKADVADALLKRLSMFVLRAKVKLGVAGLRVQGVSIPNIDSVDTELLQRHGVPAEAAELPRRPPVWTLVQTDSATWIAAPSAVENTDRWWCAGAEPAGPAGATGRWQAEDMAAGLPWIEAATQDLFIPQTLNLDLIDGVSFTKGCYPGQEIVARSHYRGTVKRRMAYGVVEQAAQHNDTQALAGTDTFDAGKPGNPCGRVINAAYNNADERIHILMEVQLADLDSADFRLGHATGPQIRVRPMPYSIASADLTS
jgi:folate-binding protein YgfZ